MAIFKGMKRYRRARVEYCLEGLFRRWFTDALDGIGTMGVSLWGRFQENALTVLCLLIVGSSALNQILPDAAASDSGIFGPTYGEIVESLENAALDAPQWVRMVTYGLSEEGQPLVLLRFAADEELGQVLAPGKWRSRQEQKQSLFPALKLRPVIRPAVYLSGATHGNEYLNIADRLGLYFAGHVEELPFLERFLMSGGIVYIIPVVNPDGYMRRTRSNARRKDLNRDFPLRKSGTTGFTQSETRAIADFFHQENAMYPIQMLLTMDYHCCKGALLHPWSFQADPLPEEDLVAHQEIGVIMQSFFGNEYEVGSSPEILPGNRVGTSKDYYYENYGSLSFTFEGKRGVEAQNFQKHLDFWEAIFAQLLD